MSTGSASRLERQVNGSLVQRRALVSPYLQDDGIRLFADNAEKDIAFQALRGVHRLATVL